MKHLLTAYVLLTCVAVPILTRETPAADPTPDPLPFPDRCNCYAVEPDTQCVEWANENCEVMPDRGPRKPKFESDAYNLRDYRE
jgi:hypothetical protein